MTLTQQAVCTLLAAFGTALAGTPSAHAQQDAPPTQPPAPIVRATPRPQVPRVQPVTPGALSPRVPAATPGTRTPGTAGGATTAPAHRPPTTIQTPGTQTSSPTATPHATVPRSTAPTAATPGSTVRPLTPRPSATTPAPGTAAPRTAAQSTTAAAATGTTTGAARTTPTQPTTPPAPPKLSTTGVNKSVIVLDPSHGGTDSGGRIGENTLEKNVTLALAFRLRTLLVARGFTVVLTRDSDAALAPPPASSPNAPTAPLTLDDRAGIANHPRAAACLLLHATGRGTGVHLYTSELDPVPAEANILPWLTAQAAWIPASQRLEQGLGAALGRSHIPLVSSSASVRPVDSLTCPAVVLELAPETDIPASINDAGYQERVAAALAGALVFWQNQVQSPVKLPPPPKPVHIVKPAPADVPEEAQP